MKQSRPSMNKGFHLASDLSDAHEVQTQPQAGTAKWAQAAGRGEQRYSQPKEQKGWGSQQTCGRWQDLRTRREPDPQQVLLRNIEPKAQDGVGRANTGPRDKALP